MRYRRYVGQWKEGKMHGHGVKQDPHGNLFEGEWKEGKPQPKEKLKGDLMGWLNEAVGSVSAGPRRRNDYTSVSTHDDD